MIHETDTVGSQEKKGKRPSTAVYLQDLCYEHVDDSDSDSCISKEKSYAAIFERPERLRAVNLGLAAALSRLYEATSSTSTSSSRRLKKRPVSPSGRQNDSLATLNNIELEPDRIHFPSLDLTVLQSTARSEIRNYSVAADFVHQHPYLQTLVRWAIYSLDERSLAAIGVKPPRHIPESDMYLGPGSIDAIEGAIGTISEAVDDVMKSTPVLSPAVPIELDDPEPNVTAHRAFVSIRPPGHHCDEQNPGGFCWVNNVGIAAAHAFIYHGINRAVVLDIDLHHGNGTQAFAQAINQNNVDPEEEYGYPLNGRAIRMFYGSIHDILSYPCEDGDPDLIEAASLSVHGTDEQYIENVHLEPYASEGFFWNVLYKEHYCKLFRRAEAFVKETGEADDVIVFISCGFDACEHEDPAISRHHRKVPASFYYRFTKDAVAFAERYARGRIISILEGGYSDRALISGTMAHLCGLVDAGKSDSMVDEQWWSVHNLYKLEQAIKNPPSHSRATRSKGPWIKRTIDILSRIETDAAKQATPYFPSH